MSKNEIKIYTPEELSKSETNLLNAEQLEYILAKTPQQFIKKRPAKGGGTWNYVSTGYIVKVLNLMFGWDWDCEIESEQIIGTQVIVRCRLSCRTHEGKTIVKTQYGRKDITFKKATQDFLDIGNDFKAAASDGLKKCASMIGIASDVYFKDEYKEFEGEIVEKDDLLIDLKQLYNAKKDSLDDATAQHIAAIIDERAERSYIKAINILKAL
jgi:hypothetical protein